MRASPAAAIALLSLLLVGCGSPAGPSATASGSASVPASVPASPSPSPSPSPSSSPAPTVALACLSVLPDECAQLYEGAVAALPAGHPEVSAASVQAHGCSNPPCLPGLAARGGGQVLVEYVGGVGAAMVTLSLGSGTVRYELGEAFVTGPLQPESGPAPAEGPFSLGHCGLSSPMDYDGSFWDPVGQVDGDAPEAINAAQGTMRLLAPDDAEFRASSGFTVRFRRHDGPKAFQLCM